MKHRFAALSACLALAYSPVATAQEDPLSVVAAAVREKGYECSAPESVKPDPARTSPGEKAWIINCGNGSYLVKFMGDTGATVEPVGG